MRVVRLFTIALIFWIVAAFIAFLVVAFTGVYPVGADVPHWSATRHAIGLVRGHAIERRTADIDVPPLDDPALVKLGAEHYAEMCTGCHLAPGMGHSELRDGLYPKPPDLSRLAPRPAQAFWIIKHGLKMTAMPAWGKTHDDRTIWALVAYLQKQPRMSAAKYHELTASVRKVDHAAGEDSTATMPRRALAPPTEVPAQRPVAVMPPVEPASAGIAPAEASSAY